MTMEERARIANKKWLLSDEVSNNGYEQGYIKGATEQKEIDDQEKSDALFIQYEMLIERFCKFLKDNIDPKLIIYHENNWTNLDEFIKRIKKSI